MEKVLSLFVIVILCVACLVRCDTNDYSVDFDETVDYMNNTATLETSEEEIIVAGSESMESVTHEIEVDGNILTVVYDTAGYDTSKWKVTDNKRIRFQVYETEETEDLIFVEHVHCDMTIQATEQGTNGITHDSMDATFSEAGNQPGFLIGPEGKSYEDIFSVEGYNETFLSIHGNMYHIHGEETRYIEENLYENGVYGEKLTVVFRFAVKNPGDEYFHTCTVIDEVSVMTEKSKYKESIVKEVSTEKMTEGLSVPVKDTSDPEDEVSASESEESGTFFSNPF